MKLVQARRLELKIVPQNGLMEKLRSWSMLAENCFWSLKDQSFTLIKNTKNVKYQVQNFIRKEKREVYETNLRQKKNKPRELWKTLKSTSLPSRVVTASNICWKDKNKIVFNATKNSSSLKLFFSSCAKPGIYATYFA